MKTKFKKIFASALVLTVILSAGYSFIEAGLMSAQSATNNVQVNLNVTAGITLSTPAAVTMNPLTSSVNTSFASTTWTTNTNNDDGYTLNLKADHATYPAMRTVAPSPVYDGVSTGFAFADIATATPAVWSTALGTNAYKFGFSAWGTDVATATYGTGNACATGSTVPSNLNFRGFNKNVDTVVATRTTVTSTSGHATSVCFGAGQNGVYAPSGTYQATITATAVVN